MAFTTGQTDIAFVKEEAVRGTLEVPAGTDVARMIADADLSQLKGTAESLERVNSYSVMDLLSLRYNPGSFTIPMYATRTGVVDSAVPSRDTILKNAFGRKTVNAGTNITYNLYRTSDPQLNFSVFYRKGGVTIQCAGGFVKDLTFPFQADATEAAIFRMNAAGEFYQMFWVGEDVTTEALTTTDAGLTKFKVAPASCTPNDGTASAAVKVAGKFTIGAYVMVGALTTSHKITAIDPSTGIVTVTPAFGSNQATGALVRGYIPVESETGTEISAHKGFVSYGGTNDGTVLGGTLHLTVNRRTLNEAKNNLDYPDADAFEGRRAVALEAFRAYFDPRGSIAKDLQFARADRLTRKAINIDFGNEAGLIWQFQIPAAITREPRLRGDGIVEIEMIEGGYGTSGDDELVLVSK